MRNLATYSQRLNSEVRFGCFFGPYEPMHIILP